MTEYIYITLVFIAIATTSFLTIYAWQKRSAPGALSFASFTLLTTIWSIMAVLVLLDKGNTPAQFFWTRIKFDSISLVPISLFAFALQYTGKQAWLKRHYLIALLILPCLTNLIIWTNEYHALMWVVPIPGQIGIWYWVHTAYSYSLILIGMVMLAVTVLRSADLYRWQAITLLLGLASPLIINILYTFRIMYYKDMDLTPLTFTLTGLAFGWSLFRYRLFDLVPVARVTLIDSLTDGMFVLDLQNRILDLNPAAERIIRQTKIDIIGQPAEQVMAQWAKIVEQFQNNLSTQTEIVVVEHHIPRYYDLRISPLYNPQRLISGRLILLRDITERKQIEEAMRESEEKYRSLVERANDGICILQDGLAKYANPRLAQISGYSVEAMLNTPFTQYISPVELPKVVDRYRRRMAGENVEAMYETLFRCQDGHDKNVELNSGLISYQGRPADLVFVRDITERKLVEDALRQNEIRYRTFVENIPIGVFRNTPGADGRFLMVNQAFLKMFGFASAEELNGLTVADVYIEVEDRQSFSSKLAALGSIVGNELHFKRRDGTSFWGLLTTRLVRDERTGQVAYFDGTVQDITECKRAVERMQRALQETKELLGAAQAILGATELTDICHNLAVHFRKLVQAEWMVIDLVDHQRRQVTLTMYDGSHLSGESLPNYDKLERGIAGMVFRSKQPILSLDANDGLEPAETKALRIENGTGAILVVPLMVKENVIGLATAVNQINQRQFNQHDVDLLMTLATQAAAAIDNVRLVDAERQRMEQELKTAQQIQMSLLPPTAPQIAGLDIAGYSRPARQVGGYFYNYFVFDQNHLGMAVGDVSGKGMQAALMMTLSFGLLTNEVRRATSPTALLALLNNGLRSHTQRNKMNTALSYLTLEHIGQAWQLQVANAGLIAPMLRRNNGSVEWLEVGGLPLGMMSELDYDSLQLTLYHGDSLILSSDGVVEAMNSESEMYGFERLAACVKNAPHDSTAKALQEWILTAVCDFVGQAEPHDDMTIVVVKGSSD